MDLAETTVKFLAFVLFYVIASARNNPLLLYWK